MALTDTFVRQTKHSGKPAGDKHTDGGGMYLLIKSAGKYWRMDYIHANKRKTLALGVYPATTLADARRKRDAARKLLASNLDPSTAKKQEKAGRAASNANTFEVIALEWHALKAKTTTPGTTQKRLAHLKTHAFPKLGNLPIAEVKPAEVLAMLNAVVVGGSPYTASRMREICGGVFRFAIQTGRATYDPAASMRGAIEKTTVNHRPALTTRREFGEFVRALRDTQRATPLTRLCARLGLLTWTRPGELRQARWNQFDIENAEWRIPAIVMKTGKNQQAHTVPLSPQALALLPQLRDLSGHTDRLFPCSGNAGGTISTNTVNGLFKRLGFEGRQSHHGLRASARSLLSERGWTIEALERQLDHKEANKAVAAYARSQHLTERFKFMTDWGSLVATLESGDNVIPLPAKAA